MVALTSPRAILFDWDNTLVDNWRSIQRALNATFSAMGHPSWSLDETKSRVRESLRDSFPRMFGERWREAHDVFYDTIARHHLDTLTPLPGAAALLEDLHSRGRHMAVVSNKRGDLLRREARHLGWDRYFAKIVGATDAERDKPAPDVVALALAGSGVAPGPDVWFVGDNEIDMSCAHRAGCVAILLSAVPAHGAAFTAPPPARRISDCFELRQLVQSL